MKSGGGTEGWASVGGGEVVFEDFFLSVCLFCTTERLPR